MLLSKIVPMMQETHVSRLKANLDSTGDASLQNAIQLAVDSLSTVPPYGHREVRSVPEVAEVIEHSLRQCRKRVRRDAICK